MGEKLQAVSEAGDGRERHASPAGQTHLDCPTETPAFQLAILQPAGAFHL